MVSNVSLLSLSIILFGRFGIGSSAFLGDNNPHFRRIKSNLYHATFRNSPPPQQPLAGVKVWLEQAEEGFVDEDENLMMGEICLRAVKAFASNADDADGVKRLLCAGALVQRPSSNVCDAWLADAFMDETNLQFKGATLVIDDLFHYHLKRSNAVDIEGISSTFVVQSGLAESAYHCASYMAARQRGFKPLKEYTVEWHDLSHTDSIPQYLRNLDMEEEDPDAMLFDFSNCSDIYCKEVEFSSLAFSITDILQKMKGETVLE